MYATPAHLEPLLFENLSAEDEALSLDLIDRATRAVDGYLGATVDYVTDDVLSLTATGPTSTVRLIKPVDAVSLVTVNGDTIDGYLYAGTTLALPVELEFGDALEVTYSHGYDPIPDVVVDVTSELAASELARARAARDLAAGMTASQGVQSEAVDGYSVAYQSVSAVAQQELARRWSSSLALTDEQKSRLAKYRQTGRSSSPALRYR